MPYKKKLAIVSSLALFCATTFTSIQVSSAASNQAIKCDRNFQLVSGNWVSTSYCEEAYFAKVAQSYGFNVSATSIRNKPFQKRNICRALINDTRVTGMCKQF